MNIVEIKTFKFEELKEQSQQNDISIGGLCENVVSYCQYDCYYDVNLKGV